jgi:hypothetical protein
LSFRFRIASVFLVLDAMGSVFLSVRVLSAPSGS